MKKFGLDHYNTNNEELDLHEEPYDGYVCYPRSILEEPEFLELMFSLHQAKKHPDPRQLPKDLRQLMMFLGLSSSDFSDLKIDMVRHHAPNPKQ